MHASDVMSSPVISIPPSLPVPQIAELLQRERIGGVPVLAGGHLVGMVTEADLLHRHEIGTDAVRPHQPWWRRLRSFDHLARDYVKSHGRTAQHVMSRQVKVVDGDAELAEVAALFDEAAIGRAPVVRDGDVVGIVARADLVKALARRGHEDAAGGDTGDEAIRRRLVAELAGQPWWNGGWENVQVLHGVVVFKGVVENETHRLAARVAAENIPGVRGVQDDRMLSSELPSML